ncbi:ABC transporter transmembrane region family protein, partial [Chlamydia psittaci 01DC11]
MVYLLGKLIDIGVSLICVKMATNATKLLRSDAYKALMKMPISFFDSINTGEVMSIISNDADNILFGLSDVIAQL